MPSKITYIKTHWGNKNEVNDAAIAGFRLEGYSGLEVNVAACSEKSEAIVERLHANDFTFVAQQWLPPADESVHQYIGRLKANLDRIAGLHPKFINSHTGKDYFLFDENCRVIEVMKHFSKDTSIPVYHETHRGRFAFHAKTTLEYLVAFPDLEFTADFSHWCTVSESLLQDQQQTLDRIIPHVRYIHARVGYEHSPQVNDPAAPEWDAHLQRFYGWWDSIIGSNKEAGRSEMYICPEFGPMPYMPSHPYTRVPITDQDGVNAWMLQQLKSRYAV
ncbi:MAG: sugar phosphate isomerase/epimerase [Bacteroidetes bacterium]|nr:sugar phosphate isomerase/epimerase [Bacteroidota bacterium]